MEYEFNWKEKGVIIVYRGLLDIPGMIACFDKLHGDERYDSLAYVIHDFCDARPQPVEPGEMEELSARSIGASFTVPKLNLAVVTTDSNILDLLQLYVRDLKEANTDWVVSVFKTMEEALDWVE